MSDCYHDFELTFYSGTFNYGTETCTKCSVWGEM